jgi:hypothetical protein
MSKKTIKSGDIFDNWVILDSNEEEWNVGILE